MTISLARKVWLVIAKDHLISAFLNASPLWFTTLNASSIFRRSVPMLSSRTVPRIESTLPLNASSTNRIAVARRDYNESVRDYDTSLRTFPTIIWAKTAYSSAKPMQLFEAAPAAQGAPTVSFAPPVAATPAAPRPSAP